MAHLTNITAQLFRQTLFRLLKRQKGTGKITLNCIKNFTFVFLGAFEYSLFTVSSKDNTPCLFQGTFTCTFTCTSTSLFSNNKSIYTWKKTRVISWLHSWTASFLTGIILQLFCKKMSNCVCMYTNIKVRKMVVKSPSF